MQILNTDFYLVRLSEYQDGTTLNQYLRDQIHLTGTKKMCLEGGCGSCVVSVTKKHPISNKEVTISVNSVKSGYW